MVRKSGTSKVLVIFVVARIGVGSRPFYTRKMKGSDLRLNLIVRERWRGGRM